MSECSRELGGRLHLLTGKAQGVYFALVCYGGADGVAYPSVKTLAQDTGTSAKTVQRALKQIIAVGMAIVVEAGGGRARPTRYKIAPSHMAPQTGVAHTIGDVEVGVSGTNPDTCVTVTQANPDNRAAVTGRNPVTPVLKPRHLQPDTLSVVSPEETENDNKQACRSEVRVRLEQLGVKGHKLKELTSQSNLTVEQVDAVYKMATSKSGGLNANPVGLLIRMLQDGERGEQQLAMDTAARQREMVITEATYRAVEFLESLPKHIDPSVLKEAKAWAGHIGMPGVLATAREAVPLLLVRDSHGTPSWHVLPASHDAVLLTCYDYDRNNTIRGQKFARLYAEQHGDEVSPDASNGVAGQHRVGYNNHHAESADDHD